MWISIYLPYIYQSNKQTNKQTKPSINKGRFPLNRQTGVANNANFAVKESMSPASDYV